MKTATVVLMAGVFAAVFVSAASAQRETRAQARARCIAQVNTTYSVPQDPLRGGADTGRNRRFLYRACMTSAGYK